MCAQRVASLYAEIGADTRGLKRGLDETKTGLQSAQRKFTNFTAGAVAGFAAIGGAVIAAKKAIEFAKEGAQLEFVRGKFDRLAMSVDTTSEALVKDLRNATRGTVSDAQLMASATDFMSLGLAKTRGEVIRLTRVAGALGMNMNQLVLTLTNQTTMRFDALGVSVDGFDEKVKKLKETGMDANAAFTEAFLQQAEEQIKKVGDIADTNAGKIMQFEASLANLSDTAKLSAAPALGTLAVELNRVLQESMEFDKAIADHNTTLEQNRDALLKYSSSWEEYRQAILDMLPSEEMRAELIRSERFELDSTTKAMFYFTQELYNAAKAGQVFNARFDEEIPLAAELSERLTLAGKAGGDMAREVGKAGSAVKKLGTLADETTPQIGGLMDNLNRKIDSPIQDFIKDLEWYRGGGRVFERTFENIKTAFDSGAITPAEADQYMKELYIAVSDFQNEIGQIDATEAAQNISDTMGASITEARDWINGTDSIMGALTALTSKKWYVDITYRYHKQGSPGPGTGSPDDLEPGLTPGGAHGLDMIVPPGYPSDTFSIRATSGEHVQITPAGAAGGSDGVTIVQNVYPSPGMDEYAIANYAALVMSQRARRSALAGAGYVGL